MSKNAISRAQKQTSTPEAVWRKPGLRMHSLMRPRTGHVNQTFQERTEACGFTNGDPQRPLKRHRAEARKTDHDDEIEALRTLLTVNVRSIAVRSADPEALLWPLIAALGLLIDEFLEETSEFEMQELEDALQHLETITSGKVKFARTAQPLHDEANND
jgi:hypothetical protein